MGQRANLQALTGLPFVIAWGLLVGLGTIGLVRYQATPAADQGSIPDRWPVDAGIARPTERALLLMFLHPRCPCSMASLHELQQVLSRSGNALDAKVIFVIPPNAPSDWHDQGALLTAAHALRGVTVINDEGAKIASEFAATTSGQVALYNAQGKLQFHGGITDGRGHEGDNSGLDSVLALVLGRQPALASTAAYGCSLGVCSLKDSK
jgi:hypothetical protein